jgi:hypothetical protein
LPSANTLNICLGHRPFPEAHADFVDLLVSPNLVGGSIRRKAYLPDEINGPHGHALSEYGQLIWIYRNLDALANGFEYLNVFQYRRFISPTPVDRVKLEVDSWVTVVTEADLPDLAYCFSRAQPGMLFNTPIDVRPSVLSQYAAAHVLSDMLAFVDFLLAENILDDKTVAEFVSTRQAVFSCAIGIYRVDAYRAIFEVLEQAAQFLHSARFVPREGYQRRTVGFLLERLHSFLLLKFLARGANFGYNMMISDVPELSTTVERVG